MLRRPLMLETMLPLGDPFVPTSGRDRPPPANARYAHSPAVKAGLTIAAVMLSGLMGCGGQPAPYVDNPSDAHRAGGYPGSTGAGEEQTGHDGADATPGGEPSVGHGNVGHGAEPGPEDVVTAPGPNDAVAPPPDDAPEAPPASPPTVEFSEPKFTSGDVPKVVANLKKQKDTIAECVAKHGGLSADVAEIEVQFLVRAQGKAEGVDINKSKSVQADAVQCVKNALKNKWVGTPSSDPIGVTITIGLKKAGS